MAIRDIELLRHIADDAFAEAHEDRTTIRAGLLATLPAGGAVDRARLRWIRRADRAELWRTEGARDTAALLSAVFNISNWKARRWIGAAHKLEELPLIAAALENGSLSLDKVCELVRFATPEMEKKLITWARHVTVATIRERGDEARRRALIEAERAQRARYLRSHRWDDHMVVDAFLPIAEGTALMNAVDELAHQLPRHPDEGHMSTDEETSMEQRRADALVLLVTKPDASRALVTDEASDASEETTTHLEDEYDPAIPEFVVYASIDALRGDSGTCVLGSAGALHPETARRLSCDSCLQTVVTGEGEIPLGIGRRSRVIPRWLRRLVMRRDHHRCSFPGCAMSRFLDVHHIVHWARGGLTDIDNLVTLCPFHHTLVHEWRWSVTLDARQRPIWFRPGGRIYEPGVPPPDVAVVRDPDPIGFAESYGQLLRWVPRLDPRLRDPHDRTADSMRARRRYQDTIPDWARTELKEPAAAPP
ncbi:MAG TPA: DUF222 domain-containing protein [Actinomycetota bacterium]|nr:DUF222 domain-containing protein [Actinomycetota bacterium]